MWATTPPSASTQPFPAAYAHMPAKPSSHSSWRPAPPAPAGRPGRRRRARRRRRRRPRPDALHDLGQVTRPLHGHREAGEVVGVGAGAPGPRTGRSRSAPDVPPHAVQPTGPYVKCRSVPDIGQRDPEQVAATLTRWLATKSDDGRRPRGLRRPGPRLQRLLQRDHPVPHPLGRRRGAAPRRPGGTDQAPALPGRRVLDPVPGDARPGRRRVGRPAPPPRPLRGGPPVPRGAVLHHGPHRGPGALRQHPLHHGGLGASRPRPSSRSACGGAGSTRWPRCTGRTGGPSGWTGWATPPGARRGSSSRCRTTGTSSTGRPRARRCR